MITEKNLSILCSILRRIVSVACLLVMANATATTPVLYTYYAYYFYPTGGADPTFTYYVPT